MDVDDYPMEFTMRIAAQHPHAEPNTEVMIDGVDDFLGADVDFGNLGEIDQPKYSISSHGSMQPVIQDPSIGMDSFSSFGGTRPGGRLGLDGMELTSQSAGGLASPAMDPTPPPM